MGNHHRFFVPTEYIIDGVATIAGDTAHQIQRVLRLREGETICLLDGGGSELSAVIKGFSGGSVVAEIVEERKCCAEPAIQVALAICMPKGDKLELIVQKCTELGISKYVLIESERTISRPDTGKLSDRMKRWHKIAAEAAEQCGRARIPELEGIVKFTAVPDIVAQYDLALVAWEDEDQESIRDVISANPNLSSLVIIIGPEGGLTPREVQIARSAGARCVTLGKRVLRAETAAIAAAAVLMSELDS